MIHGVVFTLPGFWVFEYQLVQLANIYVNIAQVLHLKFQFFLFIFHSICSVHKIELKILYGMSINDLWNIFVNVYVIVEVLSYVIMYIYIHTYKHT